MLKGIDFNKKKSYIIDISNDVVAEQRLDNMKIKTETFAKKYPLTTKAVGGNVDKLIVNVHASPKNFELLESLFDFGYVRPISQVGSGRFSGIDNRLESVKTLLDVANIKYVVCNDAPRGGKLGYIVALAEGWTAINDGGEIRYHSVQDGINTRSIRADFFEVFGVAAE